MSKHKKCNFVVPYVVVVHFEYKEQILCYHIKTWTNMQDYLLEG